MPRDFRAAYIKKTSPQSPLDGRNPLSSRIRQDSSPLRQVRSPSHLALGRSTGLPLHALQHWQVSSVAPSSYAMAGISGSGIPPSPGGTGGPSSTNPLGGTPLASAPSAYLELDPRVAAKLDRLIWLIHHYFPNHEPNQPLVDSANKHLIALVGRLNDLSRRLAPRYETFSAEDIKETRGPLFEGIDSHTTEEFKRLDLEEIRKLLAYLEIMKYITLEESERIGRNGIILPNGEAKYHRSPSLQEALSPYQHYESCQSFRNIFEVITHLVEILIEECDLWNVTLYLYDAPQDEVLRAFSSMTIHNPDADRSEQLDSWRQRHPIYRRVDKYHGELVIPNLPAYLEAKTPESVSLDAAAIQRDAKDFIHPGIWYGFSLRTKRFLSPEQPLTDETLAYLTIRSGIPRNLDAFMKQRGMNPSEKVRIIKVLEAIPLPTFTAYTPLGKGIPIPDPRLFHPLLEAFGSLLGGAIDDPSTKGSSLREKADTELRRNKLKKKVAEQISAASELLDWLHLENECTRARGVPPCSLEKAYTNPALPILTPVKRVLGQLMRLVIYPYHSGKFKGLDHLEAGQQYLFGCSHQSNLDWLHFLPEISFKLKTVVRMITLGNFFEQGGKFSLWKLIGWSARQLHLICYRRGAPTLKEAVQDQIDAISRGDSTCVFPSGVAQPKKAEVGRWGIAKAYLEAEKDPRFVPMCLNGVKSAAEAASSWRKFLRLNPLYWVYGTAKKLLYTFLTRLGITRHYPGSIVIIGAPIDLREYKLAYRAATSDEIRFRILEEVSAIMMEAIRQLEENRYQADEAWNTYHHMRTNHAVAHYQAKQKRWEKEIDERVIPPLANGISGKMLRPYHWPISLVAHIIADLHIDFTAIEWAHAALLKGIVSIKSARDPKATAVATWQTAIRLMKAGKREAAFQKMGEILGLLYLAWQPHYALLAQGEPVSVLRRMRKLHDGLTDDHLSHRTEAYRDLEGIAPLPFMPIGKNEALTICFDRVAVATYHARFLTASELPTYQTTYRSHIGIEGAEYRQLSPEEIRNRLGPKIADFIPIQVGTETRYYYPYLLDEGTRDLFQELVPVLYQQTEALLIWMLAQMKQELFPHGLELDHRYHDRSKTT